MIQKGTLRLTGGSAKAPLTVKCGRCFMSKQKLEAETVVRKTTEKSIGKFRVWTKKKKMMQTPVTTEKYKDNY